MDTPTTAQLNALYRLAGHRYGWGYIGRRQGQTFKALERRGLVEIHHPASEPTAVLTDAGRAKVAERWPKSPVVLGTYDTPRGGWDLRERVAA